MAKIHVKMVNDEQFTISKAFYGKEGPLATLQDAQIQMSFLMTKMATITTDQGKMLNVSQIAYTWIEN